MYKKPCEHPIISTFGEMGLAYTGPLLVCGDCGTEWRLPDLKLILRQHAQFVSVLKDISNEDNIWIDPARTAQHILDQDIDAVIQ